MVCHLYMNQLCGLNCRHCILQLNFGVKIGYDNNLGGGGSLGQQGYLGNFNFAPGLYPGQKLTVVIKNQATNMNNICSQNEC